MVCIYRAPVKFAYQFWANHLPLQTVFKIPQYTLYSEILKTVVRTYFPARESSFGECPPTNSSQTKRNVRRILGSGYGRPQNATGHKEKN